MAAPRPCDTGRGSATLRGGDCIAAPQEETRDDPERDRSARVRPLRRVLPWAPRPARILEEGRGAHDRRRVGAGDGRGAAAPLCARPDDLLHRPEDQSPVRGYPSPGGTSGTMRGYLVQPN